MESGGAGARSRGDEGVRVKDWFQYGAYGLGVMLVIKNSGSFRSTVRVNVN